ncbi:helix-turn-helix domain-containing protein [Solidesulfovibrio sp. C21]|uniref:AraC family transcriptional regulator n=1 Tax=Solidesulfovibrio sp. C21 TaxID=3398613 RepID=UPI0039FC9424
MEKDTKRMSAEELFGSFSTLHNIQDAEVGYEYHWRWPREIGVGSLSMIKFRPGLLLAVGNYHLSRETEVDFSLENPFWVLAFNVAKDPEKATFDQNGCNWNYEPGQSAIFYQPQWKGTAKLPVRAHVGTVTVYITPELLRTFMDCHRRSFLPCTHPIFNKDCNQFYSQPLEMTTNINTVINQILNCPYQGAMNRLYLESKTLELLTYSLSQFFSPEAIWKKKNNCSDEEVKQIHRAKELIGQDLQTPPRLQELARVVGLSHTKLNQCFREMFGTTIFGYLRELRLNRAKSLLDNGCMNVTEVAYAVGYSSLSHFAKSFKAHHGMAPGSYMHKACCKSGRSCPVISGREELFR